MGVSDTGSRALAIATLVSWLITVSIGLYMLRSLIARGGIRQQRATKDGLPPAALFGHFSLALTGLLAWISYLATGWIALAWTSVGLLMPAIGLGIGTVTLWTPYPGPARGAGGTPPAAQAGQADAKPTALPEEMLVSHYTREELAIALADQERAAKIMDHLVLRLLTAPARPPKRAWRQMTAVIPATHGLGAIATFLLAATTTVIAAVRL